MLMMYDRWRKLERAMYKPKDDTFDISKVPDIYDSIKYDALHNKHLSGLDYRQARCRPTCVLQGSPHLLHRFVVHSSLC